MQAYLNTPIRHAFHLPVGDGHALYVEECGNPEGIPVLFVHGGPGGYVGEVSRRFFDPDKYRIILFDQRGTGKSQPFLSLVENLVAQSVQDIEKIRQHLKIDTWILFGGSYGTTLSLAYAIEFPERVRHLVLRGIFLGRKEDIDWLFQEGASYFYPHEFERFKNFIPSSEQDDLVTAYYHRMIGSDQELADRALFEWALWESSIIKLIPSEATLPKEVTRGVKSIGLLEAHFFYHKMGWDQDDYLLTHANRLSQIPIHIFHGRYDVDCRPSGAYDLKAACPHASLHIVEGAGHSPSDLALFEALLNQMELLKN